MKFTISRSKWRSGGNGNNQLGKSSVRLLNDEGYMCCLGMCIEQLGHPIEELLNIVTPGQLSNDVEIFAHNHCNTQFSLDAMNINKGMV